jgi:hypothetical protein
LKRNREEQLAPLLRYSLPENTEVKMVFQLVRRKKSFDVWNKRLKIISAIDL